MLTEFWAKAALVTFQPSSLSNFTPATWNLATSSLSSHITLDFFPNLLSKLQSGWLFYYTDRIMLLLRLKLIHSLSVKVQNPSHNLPGLYLPLQLGDHTGVYPLLKFNYWLLAVSSFGQCSAWPLLTALSSSCSQASAFELNPTHSTLLCPMGSAFQALTTPKIQ